MFYGKGYILVVQEGFGVYRVKRRGKIPQMLGKKPLGKKLASGKLEFTYEGDVDASHEEVDGSC